MVNPNKKAAGWYPAAFEKSKLNNHPHPIKERPAKPLPPYGGKLFAQMEAGRPVTNDIWLFAGHECWQYAQKFMTTQAVLALPRGEDPSNYRWCVQGLNIFARDCTYLSKKYAWALEESYIRKLAHVLMAAGSPIVRLICFDGSMVIYRRDC
jgi:hypothetical protein